MFQVHARWSFISNEKYTSNKVDRSLAEKSKHDTEMQQIFQTESLFRNFSRASKFI